MAAVVLTAESAAANAEVNEPNNKKVDKVINVQCQHQNLQSFVVFFGKR